MIDATKQPSISTRDNHAPIFHMESSGPDASGIHASPTRNSQPGSQSGGVSTSQDAARVGNLAGAVVVPNRGAGCVDSSPPRAQRPAHEVASAISSVGRDSHDIEGGV